jgi:hypothetical protein
MAQAQVQYSLTFQDDAGAEASTYTGASLVDTTTLATLVTGYNTWADAVAAASDCAAIRGSIRVIPVVTPAEGKPAADSSVEKVAIVNFKTADSPHRQGFEVPGLAASLLTGRTIKVDTGALRILIDLMKTTPFTNPYAQLYTAFSDVFLAFRKRRKEVMRATVEDTLP